MRVHKQGMLVGPIKPTELGKVMQVVLDHSFSE